MINKTALALTAALVVGSTSMAHAQEKLDSTTGLRTEFYYAPLYALDQQGAPMSEQAKVYLRQHPASRTAGARRGNGNGGNGGFNARAQVPGPQFEPGVSNGSNPLQCVPEFNGAGAPQGPYCFE